MKLTYLLLPAALLFVNSIFGQSRNIGIAEVTVIEFAPNGDIWAGSMGQGVSFYKASDGTYKYFTAPDTLKSNYVTDIQLIGTANHHHAAISTGQGVTFTTDSSSVILANTIGDSIIGLQTEKDTALWAVSASNGFYRYAVRDTDAPYQQHFASIRHFTCAQKGGSDCSPGFTAGTDNSGVFIFRSPTDYDSIDVAHDSLVDNRINVIRMSDTCRVRYVGTKGGFSICRDSLPCKKFSVSMHIPNFVGDDITAIEIGCDGKLWLGTRSNGIMTVDLSAQPPFFDTIKGFTTAMITALSLDTPDCNVFAALKGDSNLYIFNQAGVYVDIFKASTGILKIKAEPFSVKIYPQPSSHQINFVAEKEIANGKFLLTDITGRTLQQFSLGTTNRFTTDVSSLSNGIYFYQIYSGNNLLKAGKVEVMK